MKCTKCDICETLYTKGGVHIVLNMADYRPNGSYGQAGGRGYIDLCTACADGMEVPHNDIKPLTRGEELEDTLRAVVWEVINDND